eukprot:TRINITY_DN3818_c0_g1_i4.p1 TRINITY_DN3818_c0_g1~~TRINITY_DN3818_c0_g1_i4.p1  ORF type:complete len:210 (+),score=30.75 TRINITY_DN3818_c0_g1_i4:1334-1963(+)
MYKCSRLTSKNSMLSNVLVCRDHFTSNVQIMKRFYERFLSIRTLPVPVIAAINGPAIGAGLCLAGATDMRITAKNVKMGYTFVSLGLHPGMGATHFLPRTVNAQAAAYLLLTGKVVKGDEALKLGLVMECLEQESEVVPRSIDIARTIAEQSPVAVRALTRNLRAAHTGDADRSLWAEASSQGHSYASKDILEGINAVKEKRAPVFPGV